MLLAPSGDLWQMRILVLPTCGDPLKHRVTAVKPGPGRWFRSLSTPAMIFNKEDLPDPFKPKIPILAP